MMYDADWYLNFFAPIPEEKWCEGSYADLEGRHCAIGHCYIGRGDRLHRKEVPEVSNLIILFEIHLNECPQTVNDRMSIRFNQHTPKKRIIAALLQIKAKQREVEITEPPITPEELMAMLPSIEITEPPVYIKDIIKEEVLEVV